MHVQKSGKRENAPGLGRKGRSRVRFGCWRGESGCKRKRKPGKLGENNGTDSSRLPARSVRGRAPLALAHPTTRTAQGAAAPRYQNIPPANEKSQVPQKRYLTFLAGAEGLEPSARGFGVDVGKYHRKRGRGCAAPFFQVSAQSVVLY